MNRSTHFKNNNFRNLNVGMADTISKENFYSLVSRVFVAVCMLVAGAQAASTEEKQFWTPRLTKAAEIIGRQAEEAESSGYVYRLPSRWVRYLHHREVREIFNGKIDSDPTDRRWFRAIHQAYVISYSDVCRDHLPENSAIYTWKRRTQIFNGLGYRESDYTNTINRVVVPIHLKPTYDRFLSYNKDKTEEVSRRVFSFTLEMLSGSLDDLGDIYKRETWVEDWALRDIRTFLKTEGCDTPSQKQFEQNLLRAANNAPSIQAQNVVIQNAELASDRSEDANIASNVAESCAIKHEYAYRDYNYCRCIGRISEARLPNKTINSLIHRYVPEKVKSIRRECLE